MVGRRQNPPDYKTTRVLRVMAEILRIFDFPFVLAIFKFEIPCFYRVIDIALCKKTLLFTRLVSREIYRIKANSLTTADGILSFFTYSIEHDQKASMSGFLPVREHSPPTPAAETQQKNPNYNSPSSLLKLLKSLSALQ